MKRKMIAVCVLLALSGCGASNVDDVKAHAPAAWKQAGYEIIGYEGYEFGRCYGPAYGCGQVWYTVQRIGNNKIIYHGLIEKWGAEYHVYNLRALNAIGPDKEGN